MTDAPDTYTGEAARLNAVARELLGAPIVPLPDEWLFADEDTVLLDDDGEDVERLDEWHDSFTHED